MRPADRIDIGLPVPVLEIGGSHVTSALVDLPAAAVLPGWLRRGLNGSGTASDILEAIIACARTVPAPQGAVWGVATPGPFDYQRGVGLFSGVGKFDSLYGVNVGAALAAGLPGHPGPIRFLNDAHAFALGEWRFGAAAGHDRCVGITLGTGIGSAFLAAGTMVDHGPEVPPEGLVNQLRIDGQPLEDAVSTRAITRSYQQRTGTPPPDVAWIAHQVARGDTTAADVLSTAFERLGEALAPWLASFGATMLVVGGSMTGSWNLIKPALEAGIDRANQPLASLAISVAARGDDAPLLGAAAYARRSPAGKPGATGAFT